MAWVILAIVVVLALAALAVMWLRQRRTKQLQQRFGPEYERTIERAGDAGGAETELRRREKRRERLEIRPLSPVVQRGYAERWRGVQARFVDEPETAVHEADTLIGEAMRDRGYPVEDFEQRAADLSVDHPQVVENYRAAHRIALDERPSTEDLRQAMVHYRALFEQLIGTHDTEPVEVKR